MIVDGVEKANKIRNMLDYMIGEVISKVFNSAG